jgi:hypothetical protein
MGTSSGSVVRSVGQRGQPTMPPKTAQHAGPLSPSERGVIKTMRRQNNLTPAPFTGGFFFAP